MDEYLVFPRWAISAKEIPPKFHEAVKNQKRFPKNGIKTTKYTKWNFLVKNLFEQFHRYANIYFVFICIINFAPQTEALTPYYALLPPLIVLTVTGVKDGYENIRRHRSDNEINNQLTEIVNSDSSTQNSKWRKLRPGDFIRLELNSVIPADVILLRSSDPQNICFVETANLDGESNLKQKEIVLDQDGFQFDLSNFYYYLRAEHPNIDLNSFHGSLHHFEDAKRISSVYMKNMLLRGCVLRNTDSVIGMVVYAGNTTKAVLNNGKMRRKVSTLELQMGKDIFWAILLLLILCTIVGVRAVIFENEQKIIIDNIKSYWYIPDSSLEVISDFVHGFFAFMTMVIILQVLIPISLYVTLEMVKLAQVWMITQDIELYSEQFNAGVECRTLNITEELGNIEHVFCDKTGTLTENSMVFRQLAIGGVKYDHQKQAAMIRRATEYDSSIRRGSKHDVLKKALSSQRPSTAGFTRENVSRRSGRSRPRSHHRRVVSDTGSISAQIAIEDLDDIDFENLVLETRVLPDYNLKSELAEELALSAKKAGEYDSNVLDFFACLAICNTVVISVEQKEKTVENKPPQTPALSLLTPIKKVSKGIMRTFGKKSEKSGGKVNMAFEPDDAKRRAETIASLSVPNLEPSRTRPMSLSINFGAKGQSANTDSSYRSKTVTFDALVTPSTPVGDGLENSNVLRPEEVIYEAESPDEAALVYCAKGYGITLMSREPNYVLVKWPNEPKLSRYKIIKMLPFDSTRKMMSVIVRFPEHNRYILLTKGADSAVFNRLRKDQNDKRTLSEGHVDSYARSGLRTLVFGKRELSQEEAFAYREKIEEAEQDLENTDMALQQAYTEIEKDLEFLGVTAIEDRLQDGVPETIKSLREAGLAVWVLTGDKLQTAIEISRSCNLIKPNDNVVTLSERSKKTLLEKIEQLDEKPINEPAKVTTKIDLFKKFLSDFFVPRPELYRIKRRILVIDGRNLAWALDGARASFINVASKCDAVVCCRVTPLQKSSVVQLVGHFIGSRTLAIGDGANDVSMIQAANVGIGVSGNEGRQAVLAADFSVPRFKALEKLLLVHGHWNYARLAQMIKYFFFKNYVFVINLFWFQLFCGWSGSKMTPDLHITIYNIFYTGGIPIVVAVVDKILPASALARNPSLYQHCSKMEIYTKSAYWGTVIDAIFQSCVQFFVSFGVFYSSTIGFGSGEQSGSIDINQFGQITTTSCLLCGYISYCVDTYSFPWMTWLLFIGSFLLFLIIELAYNALDSSQFAYAIEYWSMEKQFTNPQFYLTVILIVVMAFIPKFLFYVIKNTQCPDMIVKQKVKKRRLKQKSNNSRQCQGCL